MQGSGRRIVRTMCPMNCHPTLCSMLAEVEDGRLVQVSGDHANPDSQGFLCVRGQASREIIGNPKRLLRPLMRHRRGQDAWREATWDEVLELIVSRMQAVGREAVGIWSGHGNSATNYGTRIGGQLMRRFAHIYGCQQWNPTMICWGLGAFGLGLMGTLDTNTKEDMGQHADLIILWGANLASQPNTARHLIAAKRRGAYVVTIDVRDTDAAAQSDEVLTIRPGTDAALARRYAATRPAMILLGGSSMHKGANGSQGGRAVACLPALTGNLGLPGGGLGPRHGSTSHGQALASIIPTTPRPPGMYIPNQMSSMIEALVDGRVRAMLLFGTDMLSSFADAGRLAAGLARTDLIVSHDLFMNETIRRFADVVLPGSSWLEQLGCKMTNTHLYLMEQALEPPGETRALSWILPALADRFNLAEFFPWKTEEEMIDAVLAHPSTGYATVADLRAEGGIRAMNISHVAYPDHRYQTPSGKVEFYSKRARDLGLPPLPVHEDLPNSPYPLMRRQGRTLTHFYGFYDHGRALPSLAKLDPAPRLWISAPDAVARGLWDGAPIRIYNERGEFQAYAQVTGRIPSGRVWMRDGWEGLNRLTSGAPAIPDEAVDIFHFSAGQAAFDARVEVAPA